MKPMLNKCIIILLVGFANVFGQQEKDSTSLVITGQTVVFFAPSQQEYDSLIEGDNSGIDEILSDFYFYLDEVVTFLIENKIRVEVTSADSIVAKLFDGKTKTYRRREFDQIVGILLTDGIQEPKVILGVETDVALIPKVREFFKLK